MLKKDDLAERRKTANDAKARVLERFRNRAAPDDPVMLEKAALRKATSDARAERQALRKAEEAARLEAIAVKAREVEEARHAEAEAAEQERLAQTLARQTADRERASRVVRDEAERKALRDQRYAARKSRKQG